jgi:hypothetical protein
MKKSHSPQLAVLHAGKESKLGKMRVDMPWMLLAYVGGLQDSLVEDVSSSPPSTTSNLTSANKLYGKVLRLALSLIILQGGQAMNKG